MDRSTLNLIDAWHQGDKNALVALIDLHAGWLRKYVRRKMSTKMRMFETSEDVVQTVLANLLQSGPTFVPESEIQFRALIARCVYNRLCELHDYSNAEKRDPDRAEPLSSPESRVCIGASSSDQPDRQATLSEEKGFIALAMQIIDPEDRRLIQWHDFEDLEFSVIAERLSKSVEGARSSYRRALARLRTQTERLRKGQIDDLVRDLDVGDAAK